MNNKFICIFLLIICLTSCSSNYLIFGSEQVGGVKISAGTNSEPVKLEIGWALNDVALVPVTINGDANAHQIIHACFAGGYPNVTLNNCSLQPVVNATSTGNSGSTVADQKAKIIVDSMSVFSSFNSATTGSAATSTIGAGLNFGKVFATGVAAENIGYGTQMELEKAPEAVRLGATTNCINAATQAKLAPADIAKLCQSTSAQQPADSTPAITLAVVSGTLCAPPAVLSASGAGAANITGATINNVSGTVVAPATTGGSARITFTTAPYTAANFPTNGPVTVTLTMKNDAPNVQQNVTATCSAAT